MSSIITKIGLEKIAEATIDNPLRLTYYALGDGNGSEIEPNENMTSLVNEKYKDRINSKNTKDNNVQIECVLRVNAPIKKGFYIRELGIFDDKYNLIAITQIPEQYRPGTEARNVLNEILFNVSLAISNSENVVVDVNEQVFATIDMMNRLLDRVESLEQNKKDLVEASVGIEKWFNTEDKYKDQDIVQVGIKTYALMDSTNILNITDYPILFKNIGAVDRGDGTFAMPNFYDGTTRHLPKGSSRVLGNFEDDAMQRITGELGTAAGWGNSDEQFEKGAIKRKLTGGNSFYQPGVNLSSTKFAIDFDNSRVAKTDEKETRMKNTAGQWYMLAKMDFNS